MPFVLYFGHVNLDIILRVTSLVDKGKSGEVLEMKERIGGTAYNAYRSLRALGVPAHIFTVVAHNFPEFLEGPVIRTRHTPQCWIITDGLEQTAYVYQGIWKHASELHIDMDTLTNYQWLHFSTGNPEFYLQVAQTAKDMDVKIGFDPSQEIHYIYSKELFRQLLSLSYIFFCNQTEYNQARKWAGDILEDKIIIRTEGARGASLYIPKHGWKRIGGYKVKVIDTTGAGDSFRAGFYAAVFRGYGLENAIKIGNLVASKVVSQETGYFTGNWEDIQASLSGQISRREQ